MEVKPMTHTYEDCPAKEAIDDLQAWQQRQNGSLQRIEKQVDRILWAIIGGLGAVCVALIGVVVGFA
jgi:hypothetical protein